MVLWELVVKGPGKLCPWSQLPPESLRIKNNDCKSRAEEYLCCLGLWPKSQCRTPVGLGWILANIHLSRTEVYGATFLSSISLNFRSHCFQKKGQIYTFLTDKNWNREFPFPRKSLFLSSSSKHLKKGHIHWPGRFPAWLWSQSHRDLSPLESPRSDPHFWHQNQNNGPAEE